MANYSIKDLEKISGIKSHTIRIWEQRYNLFNPDRTDTNIRFYNDEDVRFLLQIQVLQTLGYKISKIVDLTDSEIKEILADSKNDELNSESSELIYVNRLMEAGMRFDSVDFNTTMDELIEQFSLKNAFQNILYKVLLKVGLLWEMGDFTPAQEHFTSSLIRDRIIVETYKLKPGENKLFILFLAEKEEHEIGLLYIHFMLRYFGYKVVYLGPRVPIESLNQTINTLKPEALFSFVVSRNNLDEYYKYKEFLGKNHPSLKCYWSGAALKEADIKSEKTHILINSIEDFFKEIL